VHCAIVWIAASIWERLIVYRYDYDGEDYDGRHDSGAGLCQPYHGSACSAYLGNEIIYFTERFRPGQVENSISGKIVTALLTCRLSNGLRYRCLKIHVILNTCDAHALRSISRTAGKSVRRSFVILQPFSPLKLGQYNGIRICVFIYIFF